MRKFLLYATLAICLAVSAGCKKKDMVITADDVDHNTVLVKNDGSVQAATVETFDKNYYNLDELKGFITRQINKYNQVNGQDSIILDSLILKDGNAVLVLNYTNIEHYDNFNEVKNAFITTADAKKSNTNLPDVYVSAKDGAYASPDTALKNDKYRILVLNEKTDVLVDGTVKFFANGKLTGKSKFETGSGEQSVIIYKP